MTYESYKGMTARKVWEAADQPVVKIFRRYSFKFEDGQRCKARVLMQWNETESEWAKDRQSDKCVLHTIIIVRVCSTMPPNSQVSYVAQEKQLLRPVLITVLAKAVSMSTSL